jgi:hypothetical protein
MSQTGVQVEKRPLEALYHGSPSRRSPSPFSIATGIQTPTRERILRRLHSAVDALEVGERVVDTLRANDVYFLEARSPVDWALKQVLEVVESVLNVTLTTSEVLYTQKNYWCSI